MSTEASTVPATSAALELVGLRKEYRKLVAVDSLDLHVRAGEFVGFVGPNGAGKSTTIKMLCGQLVPTAGTVRVAGVDVVSDPGGARAKLGYVPEEPKLYDYLNAREMLEFVAEVRGAPATRIDAALEIAGLGDDAERLIREYSQGMRRRTALACAMLAQPPLLVLDEALNGLDPPSAMRVSTALQAACEAGAAVLLSTHVLDTLERVAHRIVMIREGRIVEDVPVAELDRVRARFRTPS